MVRIISYEDCAASDLIVDAVYEGAPGGHLPGEALSRLLPGVGNQGGFRASGLGDIKKFVVLYTSGEDPDWPDTLDINTGQFVYYGDNKRPGHELHDTQRSGNRILRHAFAALHGGPLERRRIPPFFVFRNPFPLTQEVLAEPDWTPEVLQRRHERLVEQLSAHWRLG